MFHIMAMEIFLRKIRILCSDMKMDNILRKNRGRNTILSSQTVTDRQKQAKQFNVQNKERGYK